MEEAGLSDPLMSSSEIELTRNGLHRGGVHGGGAAWGNRIRGRNFKFFTENWATPYVAKGHVDAVIFSFMVFESPKIVYDHQLIAEALLATGGKVAVVNGQDTLADPRGHTHYFHKRVFYFDREMRRAYC